VNDLLNQAPCGFLTVGDDGHIRYANQTLAEALELERDDIVGRHVDSILTVPSRVFYQTHVFPTLRLQRKINEVYLSLVARHGELPVLLNAARRATPEEDLSDWALMPMRQRDEYENEILRARKNAEAAAAAMDDFFARTSHELRSPLMAIRNWATILAKAGSDESIVRRGIEAIQRSAQLQARLVEDMFDHARAASGKLSLKLAEMDLRNILDVVMERVAPLAEQNGVELDWARPEAPFPVNGDAQRLEQVFGNIAQNALKFTESGGAIRARMRLEGERVTTEIQDTGQGMSPEFLPHVFERVRQEAPSKGRKGGLGLGMVIARQIVELHGGTIEAESPGKGQGSTFRVRLPLLSPERNAEAPAAQGERAAASS
jgi:signal transduction histidine kinase